MTLPYERATSGKSAVQEMRKVLTAFGASSFGVMEDFAVGEVIVQFEWRSRRVSIKASAIGYAAAWLRVHPWSASMRGSEQEHEQRALRQGQIAVYSILRDWIKGQVTAVEVGMLSFEAAFLATLLLPSGETVLQRIAATRMLEAPERSA